jgi:hypothetical protein
MAKLTIEFTGWWVSGTGAARGRDVDVVTHRDRDGLPAMPMTQIKGQLRETAMRLAAAGVDGWTEPLVELLFGSSPHANGAPSKRGALAFRGEARLEPEVRGWLAEKDQAPLKTRLFGRLAATRIDGMGVAADHTLRALEAAAPVTLVARVEREPGVELPTGFKWIIPLDQVCAATVAFGKFKTDGYGRALAKVV